MAQQLFRVPSGLSRESRRARRHPQCQPFAQFEADHRPEGGKDGEYKEGGGGGFNCKISAAAGRKTETASSRSVRTVIAQNTGFAIRNGPPMPRRWRLKISSIRLHNTRQVKATVRASGGSRSASRSCQRTARRSTRECRSRTGLQSPRALPRRQRTDARGSARGLMHPALSARIAG